GAPLWIHPNYRARLSICATEKRQMASLAATLVRDHTVIGLDGSSTLYYLARRLAGRDITVVTNGLYSALELASHPPTRVILIGGELQLTMGSIIGHVGRPMLGGYSVEGEGANSGLSGLRMHQFFTSPGGLTITDGLMDIDPDENLIKQDMIALADEIIAVADHSKIGQRALLPYAPLKAIHCLITDSASDECYLNRIREMGIRVLIPQEVPNPTSHDHFDPDAPTS
ncbi:MAG: DeoR/GlpR family DNA-binding transcription regulator, partial [Desulfofundulus sp.]